MRNKLLISVSKQPKEDGFASCKSIKLRERFLRFFFGKKSDIMVLIPSEKIDEVFIRSEGGN